MLDEWWVSKCKCLLTAPHRVSHVQTLIPMTFIHVNAYLLVVRVGRKKGDVLPSYQPIWCFFFGSFDLILLPEKQFHHSSHTHSIRVPHHYVHSTRLTSCSCKHKTHRYDRLVCTFLAPWAANFTFPPKAEEHHKPMYWSFRKRRAWY